MALAYGNKSNSIRRSKQKVHLVSMRMQGHAGPSGYDRITDYMDATVIAPPPKLSILSRVTARLLRRLITRSGVLWYHRNEFLCEMRAAGRWLTSRRGLFHFIYGENSYKYMATVKRLFPRHKIVCTFHTPADKFQSVVTQKGHLQAIDALVVVSNSQKPYFSDLVGNDKVFFIPHGVDTDVFTPGPDRQRRANGRFNCIFVGRHLRDIESMQKIVAAAKLKNPRIHFHLVSGEETLSLFYGMDNVSTYHKVTDEKLISLYRMADVLTLPLLEGTANNSILEAVACGLPIITTDLIGTRDYLNDDCAFFVPRGQTETFVDRIEMLLNDPNNCAQMAQASRKKAEELSWSAVARKFEALYQKINSC